MIFFAYNINCIERTDIFTFHYAFPVEFLSTNLNPRKNGLMVRLIMVIALSGEQFGLKTNA